MEIKVTLPQDLEKELKEKRKVEQTLEVAAQALATMCEDSRKNQAKHCEVCKKMFGGKPCQEMAYYNKWNWWDILNEIVEFGDFGE